MSRRVAALFVHRHGSYWRVADVEPWDLRRDARGYAGEDPVVAHPPCARWSKLAGFAEARTGIPAGADGGLFEFALETVRRCGGVLEHPAHSAAWVAHGLPEPPPAGGWQGDLFSPGFVCNVYQGRYGHRAPKQTWLYLASRTPPRDLLWGPPAGATHLVERMGHAERDRTPAGFRDILLELARASRVSAPDASSAKGIRNG